MTILALLALAAAAAMTINTAYAYASVLEKDYPLPPLDINNNGSKVVQLKAITEDDSDTDIKINLQNMDNNGMFENKTQVIDTEDVTDIDMNGLPQDDMKVIITEGQVFVTENPVVIEMRDLVPDITDEIIDTAEQYNKTGEIIIREYGSPVPPVLALEKDGENEDESDDDN